MPCIFEKPEKKNVQPLSSASVERLSRLEGQYLVMQSQMIGMQSSLDRILSVVQCQAHFNSLQPGYPTNAGQGSARDAGSSYPHSRFPPLPGFAPPPHKYATYGIVPSTASSSEDESEDTLPRVSLSAPIEALQGLANAAAEAAAVPSASPPIVKKRQRPEPIPKNAFPHVIEKVCWACLERHTSPTGLLSRDLFRKQKPGNFTTFSLLDVICLSLFLIQITIRSRVLWNRNAPLSLTFYKCLEEAQGIARSSLFGPVVRKEAVMGMLLLAAWSTNGWLPSGHAMRMALDLGLHRALDKLADDSGKNRSEEEERDLGSCICADLVVSLLVRSSNELGQRSTHYLRDECSIKHCRLLLAHPMASPTDVRLISLVELIAQKTQIYETLAPLNGEVNHNTLAFIRRANVALDKWWAECDELHRQTMDEESLLRKILAGELHYAKLWLVCVALRGVSWDKMPFEQRELAFQAKDAAFNCLSIFLNSTAYRAALRYAVHDSLVTLAFSGLFLLKMANLFPVELDLAAITSQVEQLAQLLSDVAAERYALTLRIMLANLRRKVGMLPGIAAPIPNLPPPLLPEGMVGPYVDTHTVGPPPLTMEELGFSWPGDRGMVNPSTIPVWIREQSLTDLGLPINGSDGIFLNMNGANGWSTEFAPTPEAW
ncbi:hypothetical protein JVT61DRAFT_3026 [Boletus reticuloceps]|uniref:Transcription factor domain-containing protein n=1 Tax=Boletus reticuloceps TaxID=495285 RepID=A0A8I3A9S3_9AGAM|nr:hypothetical protein JVT61DRAFT_3026 [Boletus reticuloceps]